MTKKSLSELFLEIRKDRGLSQVALAKSIGVSPVTISAVETKERHLSDEKIDVMSESLNLSEEKTMELKDASARFLNKIPRYMIDKLLEDDELFEYVKRYKKN